MATVLKTGTGYRLFVKGLFQFITLNNVLISMINVLISYVFNYNLK